MGFELKCLDCGNKVVIENGNVDVSKFGEIGIYPVQGRAIIECVCGKDSDLDY